MTDVVLGIHSNSAGSQDGFTSGHAWISVRVGSSTRYYGLWPDEHRITKDNGPGMDIRVGLERTIRAKASRYYLLSQSQRKKLVLKLRENVTWKYTHNCSSWASDLIYEVLGEDVDADDWLSIETPRELGRNILILEGKSPTSSHAPAVPGRGGTKHMKQGGNSSF